MNWKDELKKEMKRCLGSYSPTVEKLVESLLKKQRENEIESIDNYLLDVKNCEFVRTLPSADKLNYASLIIGIIRNVILNAPEPGGSEWNQKSVILAPSKKSVY